MNTLSWQLVAPISAICFDCDGTLSSIEGINELARYNDVSEKVETLTTIAMSETGINPDIYTERLNLVNPSKENLHTLAHEYYNNRAPDIAEIINIYQRLNKTVYIISAGLNPAVAMFGEMLQIPKENIFAVDLLFDNNGKYIQYDPHSPLIHNEGKRHIISDLMKAHKSILHIGDGLNDVTTSDLVSRFVGFGGFYYREHIAALCQFYIRTKSLTPLLPLSLTEAEIASLAIDEQGLYQKGVMAIKEGMVKV